MKKINKQILEAIHKGIQLALDDYQDIEPNSSISSINDVIDAEDVIRQRIELDKYTVDLGLPSGTKWAKYNLGVDPNKLSKPEDWYGDYYAWGETRPKEVYSWDTYQFSEEKDLIKYNKEDHLVELQLIDDAAYQNMHLYNFKFKMPTKEQFEELIEETNNKWVKNFNNSGVNGYKFTSKSDSSKYIFLPAAGDYFDSILDSVGGGGNYWSSSIYTDYLNNAWNLYFGDGEVYMNDDRRYCGFSVRPVLMKK